MNEHNISNQTQTFKIYRDNKLDLIETYKPIAKAKLNDLWVKINYWFKYNQWPQEQDIVE